jgi:hypothetical protein
MPPGSGIVVLMIAFQQIALTIKNSLMKTTVKTFVLFAAFAVCSGFLFGQSANLRGKATSAARECIAGHHSPGGLQTIANVEQVGTCPDGSPKWAVNINRVGHCPGNGDILCLVILDQIATVTFDCNENVQSIVCFE